jgi:hypothetical protein
MEVRNLMQFEGRSVSDIHPVHSWLLPSYFVLISYHAVKEIMPRQTTRFGGPRHISKKPQTQRVLIFVVDYLELDIPLLTAGSILDPYYEIWA